MTAHDDNAPRRRVLVTGAAGFIGSHLCEALLERGDAVIGLDNFDPFYGEAVKRRNLKEIEGTDDSENFAFVEADIRDAGAVSSVFAAHRPDTVVHLAALAGVRPSIAQPTRYAEVNVIGTSHILQSAAEAAVARLVIASSSSVYGADSPVPFSEETVAASPMSPYAATKRATEHISHAFHYTTGIPVSCLRFFTVYGPRQRPDLAIAKFMRRIAAGEPIDVFGDGSTSRDYTYIDDILRGILAAMERTDAHGFRVWNLGSDQPVRLDELIQAIAQTVGRDPAVNRLAPFLGDMEHTWADLTRARTELGYAAMFSLQEGLQRQWDWMRAVEAGDPTTKKPPAEGPTVPSKSG